MILPNVKLTTKQNKIQTESGYDSLDLCEDKIQFKKYPYKVVYNYNSRGFRDSEWPSSIEELKNAIWCFGDSFTVGLGSPIDRTWVNVLQQQTNKRCINVSLDGASNDWIARKVIEIIEEINPTNIVIQWSYLHRRENSDITLSDEDRRIDPWVGAINKKSDSENFNRFIENYNSIVTKNKNSNIIFSFIPNAFFCVDDLWDRVKGDSWPKFPKSYFEFNLLPEFVYEELKGYKMYDTVKTYTQLQDIINNNNIMLLKHLDFARDGLHYDLITARDFVDRIKYLIK